MNIEQAYYSILSFKNKQFKDLLAPSQLEDFKERAKRDKGFSGKLVENLLGISPKNNENDFVDGELKTFKADIEGVPKETISLTMITPERMKDIIEGLPFKDSFLYKKMKVVLYVPVLKVFNGAQLPFEEWSLGQPHLINLENPIFKDIYKIFELDYNFIQSSYQHLINLNMTEFSGCSGNFLQVRPKDSPHMKTTPIMINDKLVSKSYCGFYLSMKFIKYVQNLYNIEMGYEFDDDDY
jgi:DNA mismatch repair protein MutH